MSLQVIFCVWAFVFWNIFGGCLCFSCYFCLCMWPEYVEDDYWVLTPSAPVATFSLLQHTIFGIVSLCNTMAISFSMVSCSLSISLTILSPAVAVSWAGACCAHDSCCMVRHMVVLWKLGLHPSILTQILSHILPVYSFNSPTRRKLARGLGMEVTNASTLQEFAVPELVLITHLYGTAVGTMPTGRPVTQPTVSHTLVISTTKSCPFSLCPMSLVTSWDGMIGTVLGESLYFWQISCFSTHFFCVINHTALLFNLISPPCTWESLPILSFSSFWEAWFV